LFAASGKRFLGPRPDGRTPIHLPFERSCVSRNVLEGSCGTGQPISQRSKVDGAIATEMALFAKKAMSMKILGAEDDSDLATGEVDSKGDIWQASESGFIRHYRVMIDVYAGVRLYTGAASEVILMPAIRLRGRKGSSIFLLRMLCILAYTVDRPRIGARG